MASSGRTPTKGKKENDDKNWKSSFVRLMTSCGSGKSKDAKQKSSNLYAAPSTPPEATWTKIDDDANVSREVVTVTAIPGHGTDEEVEISYTELKEIGQGTFGIVYRARLCDTGEVVAIKKTLDDPKFKNRELMMMRQLEHPNILNLRFFFNTSGHGYKTHERYLNIVMDYIPETLFSVAKCDGTYTKPLLEPLYVKLYTYQVFRSLAYLHSLHISHRDVKPQNLLLDPETHVIKLCDFGSAKELSKGDTNVAYICSRYYRAPELVLGATEYTCQIDVWSAGCVLAELIQGHPIFPGANGPDQMVEIIKILGTPTMDDLAAINPRFTEFRFPHLVPHHWGKVLQHQPSPEAIDLISRVLVYSPMRRFTPLEACAHPFYDELRRKGTRLKNGRRLPPLFNFKPEELEINPSLNSRLRPDFDEDDEDYLDSLTKMEPPETEIPAATSLTRLESFRSSFKKKLPKIPSQLKRIGSKTGDKPQTKNVSENAGVQGTTSTEDREDIALENDVRATDQDSVENVESVSGSQIDDLDMSVTIPDIHTEPRKTKGKRSKRTDNRNTAGNSDVFVDSFTSSINQSGLDNTESVIADMESLEIQIPRKKKGKRKQKSRKESTEEGEGDTTIDDGHPEAPYASTPAGKVEKLADSPFSTPTLQSQHENLSSTSPDGNIQPQDDNDLTNSGVTEKTKKKTTKKKKVPTATLR